MFLFRLSVAKTFVPLGAGAFRGLNADLYITGELSHHDCLAAIENGRVVLARKDALHPPFVIRCSFGGAKSCRFISLTLVTKAFHSNTERAYLRQVLAPRLLNEMDRLWTGGQHDIQPASASESQVLSDHSVSVQISNRDRDPFQIIRV